MRQMKDSGVPWIGEIPSEWDIIRNKYLFNYVKGKIPESLNCEGQGIVYIGASDLEKNGNSCEYSNFTLEKLIECSVDDTLILWDGARAGTIGTGHKGMISSTIVAVRARNEKINPKYLYWYFKAFQPRLVEMVSGTTIPHMSKTFIENIMFLSLPTDLQTYISIYLDQKISLIDNIIEKTKQSIEEYKKLKQSIITEAVTKGLNPDVKMKDSGIEWIGEIPEHWEVLPIKDKITFNKGLNITKEDLTDIGENVVSYGQIHSKDNISYKISNSLFRFIMFNNSSLSDKCIVGRGDFIFADTSEDLAGTGNFVLNNNDVVIYAGYHTIILKPKSYDLIFSKYLSFLFMSDCWRAQIRSQVSGLKVFSITQKILKNSKLLLPNEFEMTGIVDYLEKKSEQIEDCIKQKESIVSELEIYKKSLIYEVVTGKKEIA